MMLLKKGLTVLKKQAPFVRAGAFIGIALLMLLQPVVGAMTAEERRDFAFQDTFFIDDPCPTGIVPVVNPNETSQDTYARSVIGVAKKFELEKTGAIAGVIAALAETNLYNVANEGQWVEPFDDSQPYRNSGIEKSVDFSVDEGQIDNDRDHLGLFKFRVSRGWSTSGSDPANEFVIRQLMTPAYVSQAFYGTPEGAQLPADLANPDALKKGAQNLPGGWIVWHNRDPVDIAKAVMEPEMDADTKPQVLARYNDPRIKVTATAMVERLWDSAPPIDLEVSITAGVPKLGNPGCGSPALLSNLQEAIVAYAWPEYRSPKGGVENARYATTRKEEYTAAIGAANEAGSYTGWNRSGIDCGAFVTRAMMDSHTDDGYNPRKGNTASQIQYLREEAAKPDGKYVRITGVNNTSQLQFGDVAIRSGRNSSGGYYGHTFIFTGHFTYTDPASGTQKEWVELAASASGSGNPLSGSDRAPMAGKEAGQVEIYEWYRRVGATTEQQFNNVGP